MQKSSSIATVLSSRKEIFSDKFWDKSYLSDDQREAEVYLFILRNRKMLNLYSVVYQLAS